MNNYKEQSTLAQEAGIRRYTQYEVIGDNGQRAAAVKPQVYHHDLWQILQAPT